MLVISSQLTFSSPKPDSGNFCIATVEGRQLFQPWSAAGASMDPSL